MTVTLIVYVHTYVGTDEYRVDRVATPATLDAVLTKAGEDIRRKVTARARPSIARPRGDKA